MKPALLIIDMQEDFLDESSPLFVKGGREIIPNIEMLLSFFRKQNLNRIFIKREHRGSIDIDKPRIPYGGKVLLPNSEGAKIVKELFPMESEIVVIKKRFSAFFHTELDLILRRLQIDTLILTGVQTPNCIRATAVDGVSYDYDVIVVSDGTASSSDEVQKANLFDLEKMGIKILNVNDVIEFIKKQLVV
ncbi:cysteine hydrolase family protein [Caldisericum exile]|uniref:Hydrolase n=1 Tax=Caldisericum exile (strain DSM 21853 / NBRC 104410 / AZM16c01) TaxID=511051 RepID=A0A7U6GDG1_CALEA|nr:isochorismatase family cysteine hydrolase [Caldisericum exile]BAL80383.1 putative hydrolase [Caldisericum exile AZM16c01]